MSLVRESPVVLESEHHQLVGVHHTSDQETAVLLCHGLTGDKVEDHRLFVHTARAFAKEGYDVLRFDFFGSGDSHGEFKETRLSHHIANIKDAVGFLKNKGYSRIVVLGISFGASAAILCAEILQIDAIILWSAVPDTKELLEQHLNVDLSTVPHNSIVVYNNWEMETAFIEDVLQFDIKQSFSQIEIPKLIVQGMRDAPLFQNGFHVFRNIARPPCDFMELPDATHTFPDPRHRRQVIRQSLIWLNRQINKG